MPYEQNGKLRQSTDKTKYLQTVSTNKARKQRLAIKEYWRTKSEGLRGNPRVFIKTFKPFLSDKGGPLDNRHNMDVNAGKPSIV